MTFRFAIPNPGIWQWIACIAASMAGASDAATARPLDDVVDSGYLTIAVYREFEPFAFERDGKLQGIDVEIGNAMASSLKVKPRFMVLTADENVDDDLRNAVWKGSVVGGPVADVMMHVPVDKELKIRNNLVVIFGRYYTEQVAVAANTSRVRNVVTLAPFLDDKIGAELDTLADFYLASAFGGQLRSNLVHYINFAKATEGLRNGEVAGLMAPRSQVEWAAKEIGPSIKIVQPSLPGLAFRHWDVGAAVKHDSRDLGYALGDVITNLRTSGKMTEIFEKFGVNYHAQFID